MHWMKILACIGFFTFYASTLGSFKWQKYCYSVSVEACCNTCYFARKFTDFYVNLFKSKINFFLTFSSFLLLVIWKLDMKEIFNMGWHRDTG